jgi:hypothetical protein
LLAVIAARIAAVPAPARIPGDNDDAGLAARHERPMAWAPLTDMPPSPLVVAWATEQESPLIRSFAHIAVNTYRSAR